MSVITINDKDRSMSYSGSGWSTGSNGTSHGTALVGDFATCLFRGSSISVFGRISAGSSDKGATSLYVMDGEHQGSTYKAVPRSDIVLIDQVFYTSPPLDPDKEHTLVITVIATGGNALWIDYLKVVSGEGTSELSLPSTQSQTATSFPSLPMQFTTTVSGTNASPSTTYIPTLPLSSSIIQPPATTSVSTVFSSSQLTQSSATATQTQSVTMSPGGLSKGAIVGTAVGSVACGLLLVAIFFFFFVRYRRKKEGQVPSRRAIPFTVPTAGHRHVLSSSNTTSESSFSAGNRSIGGYIDWGRFSTRKTYGHPAPTEQLDEAGTHHHALAAYSNATTSRR